MLGNIVDNHVKLKRIFVEPKLPEGLSPLTELSRNLWWTWQHEAIELFRQIDPVMFERVNYNPVALLDELSVEKANALLSSRSFVQQMHRVHQQFQQYMNAAPPFGHEHPKIGYFCMEYGLHQSLRLYSGGLGVLAGDYLKEMSDMHLHFVAVGLLYRYGYFQQGISLNGEQIHHFDPVKFTQLPLEPVRDQRDEWLKVHINMAGKTIWAKVWLLKVGRIPLYLLDTDIDDNAWEDRAITHQLYGGDNENRLRQELLLGIGGMRALKAIGIECDIFHLNEGHAAFLGLERLAIYMKEHQLTFEEALEMVRATQLFTTHTPVPAGHDTFPETLLRDYIYNYTYQLNISWEQLCGMGKLHVHDEAEPFSMSHFALRTCQEVNGVSRLHGEVSQKMFAELYPNYNYSENHIGYVTNCVHYPTWVAKEWHELFVATFGKDFERTAYRPEHWKKIHAVPDATIMALRQKLKKRLLDWVRISLREDLTRRGENPQKIFEIVGAIREDALVVGFARRFATYKRANLLFTNEKRLAELVNQPDKPILFLFAGKAHPADKGGQEFIRLIYNVTKNPQFRGKVVFLENYSMEMAKLLVQGVDVWLNNPTRPKEASGTSGMKAVLNGVMNFSVLDGWWCEGFKPGAGWALPEYDTYDDPKIQNELDAETIYNILENDIIPTFFNTNEQGISPAWVQHIKNTLSEIAPHFVMGRMVNDYVEKFYSKLHKRSQILKKDHFDKAKAITEWKKRIEHAWEAIELVSMHAPDTFNHSLPLGERFEAEVTVQLFNADAHDIGIEVVFYQRRSDKDLTLISRHELELKHVENHQATYACSFQLKNSGVFEYGYRMFPKHPLLPHRVDFGLVRWL